MSQRAKELARRIETMNNELVAFVESCSEKNWRKICDWEEWTVGVTARHIGAGHFRVIELAKMFIKGEELPQFTEEQINAAGNQHARKHTDCTTGEVLEILRKNGAAAIDFVAGLDDAQLDRKGHLAVAGGEITTQQFLESVILQSGGDHLAHMKTAVAA